MASESAATDWSSIVMTAEKLQAAAITDTAGGMPSVTRNIRQLLDAAESLWTKVGVPGAEARGNVFLCGRGVDAPQVPRQLERLGAAAGTLDTLDPRPDTDVDSFVRNEVQNAILGLVEAVKKADERCAARRQTDAAARAWRNKKLNIVNSFPGYAPNAATAGADSSVASAASASAYGGPSGAGRFDTTAFGLNARLDQTELAYAERLCRYNRDLEERGAAAPRADALRAFADAARVAHDDRVDEMWTVVDRVAGSVVPEGGGGGHSKYARDTPANRRAVIAAARAYLEHRYVAFMRSYVRAHMSQARVGGVPGTYPLARSFVSVYVGSGDRYRLPDGGDDDQDQDQGGQQQQARAARHDGVPLWPLVYCLVRAGDLDSAVRVLDKSGRDPALLRALAAVRARGHYADLGDQGGFAASVAGDPAADPFRRVVYSLLAAADVDAKHADVVKTADDYLWLRTCQVREPDSGGGGGGDRFTFPALQAAIRDEYQDRYGDVQPLAYFQLLFLTGQFEAAVHYLFRHPKLRSHAVHVAVVLAELGLLYGPDDLDAPTLSEHGRDRPAELNLARLVKIYCAKFENQDLGMAVNYYYCLRHIESPDGPTTLFVSYVAGLVVETEEYDRAFGYLKADGKKQNGVLDSFVVSESVKMDIVRTAAKLAEQKCDLNVSARLYELVGQYDKVLQLTNTMLSRAIQPDSFSTLDKTTNAKNKVFEYTEVLSQRLAGVEINASEEVIFTFNMLKSIYVFFEHYKNNKYTLAFDVLQTIGLIPLAISQVEERLNAFKKFDELILNLVPGVMTATMNMLYSQYSEISREESVRIVRDPEQRQAQLEYIRERARAITSFTGRVPFQINSEVINHLVQTEILLY